MSDAAPAPAAEPAALTITSRQRALILLGTLLGMLVAAINQTSVTTVLPTIASDLDGFDLYTWVFTISMLGSAVAVPVFGKLSDLYGRRLLFIIGTSTFMVGALAAGFAPTMQLLIVARAIQGIGMGAIMPLAMAIIADVVPASERGKWQGIMGAVFGLATVLGPIAGGAISDQFGWRWIFWGNVPLGVIALWTIVTQLHLPFHPRRAKIDWLGAVTFGAGLSALLLALSEGGQSHGHAWTSPLILGLFAAAALLLAAFVFVEGRAQEPLIPLPMLAERNVALTTIAGLAIGAGMFVAIFYVPLFMQVVVGVSSASSGMALVPLMMGLIISSTASGIIITKTQRYKGIIVAGPIVAIVGLYLMGQMGPDTDVLGAGWRMFIVGTGIGMSMQNLLLVAQNSVDHSQTGVVTSLATLARSVGGTVGIAILGTLMATRLPENIGARMASAGVDEAGAARANEAMSGSSSLLDVATLDIPDAVKEAIRLGASDTLTSLFVLGIPMLVIAAVASLALRRDPLSDIAAVSVVDELEHELADLVPVDPDHASELPVPTGDTRS